MALLENLHREDLNAVEEAQAYLRLTQEFKIAHNSLAQLVSKSRSHISNSIRLLSLPKSVLDLLAQNFLSANHARVLLSLEDVRLQETMAQKVIKEHLSARQLEDMVKELHPVPTARKRSSLATSSPYRTLAQEISAKIGRRIWIQATGKPGHERGKISIEFNSPEEFALITKIITTQFKV
jgi:ParB family chromosome partitioning protein